MKSDKTLYLIYSGYGVDGGFGDYSGVSWSDKPLAIKGETVWFSSESLAQEVVEKLNEESRSVFYSTGTHSSYDGEFPLEYECREIVIPENPESFYSVYEKIVEQDKERWNSNSYDDPYMDYEDYLEEKSLTESELSFDDWLVIEEQSENNHDTVEIQEIESSSLNIVKNIPSSQLMIESD